MPGLLGIATFGEQTTASRPFDGMLTVMDRGGRLIVETRKDATNRWAIGRVHLGALQPLSQLARTDQLHVLFHGELTNEPALKREIERDGQPAPTDAAALIAALYRKHRRRVAQQLQGSYCIAILDEVYGSVMLVTDRLGNYPLYWFKNADRFVFASELRAALKAHPKPVLNPAAVADILKFAFPMGDKTLAAGVDLMPSGSTLSYCARTHKVEIETYATVADLFRRADITQDAYLNEVEAASGEAMHSAVEGSHSFGLSLSGGLDTRVILSAMDRLGRSQGAATFTLGGRGCADEVIGYQLARMARTDHRFVALDDHYLDDLLPTARRMVSLTDGMYLSHGFTEMLALQGFEESSCTVLLRGHAGELAKASTAWPFHTDRQLFAMRTSDDFVRHVIARLTHVSRGDAARQVLSDAGVEALDGASAEASLRDSVDGVSLCPADLASYVYLKEYHRRVTVPSLEIFRNVADVRLPLADVRFLSAVLQGPPEWRDGVAIHQALIRANGPKYLRVRNPNTGAPAGAGPALEAVLDKLNSVLRRLNVYGYRHYHAFDGWMRRSLLDLVDKVVLHPDTLSRGVVRTDAVRRIVTEAQSGVKDHDDLLQALVVVELWQREVM